MTSSNPRWKILTPAVLVVAALAVIGVHVLRQPDSSTSPSPTILDLSAPPVPSWILDANRWGRSGDQVVLAAAETLSTNYGFGSLISSPSYMVGALGTPADDGEQSQSVSEISLIGVNRASGGPLWRNTIGDVDQCATPVDDSPLACWSDRRVVFVDLQSGKTVGDANTDFDITDARVDGTEAFVSGTQNAPRMPDEARTPVLMHGTVDDVDSVYRREFDSLGSFTYAAAWPQRSVTTVGTSNTLAGPAVTRVVDNASGESLFTHAAESLIPVSARLLRSQNGVRAGLVGTEELLDHGGNVVTGVPVPSSSALTYVGARDDESAPIFLGDGAYDPVTGAELWRNPDMVIRESGGPTSAVKALVGDTIIVTSPETQSISGLDMTTGTLRWRTPWQDAYWVRDGATDGKYYAFGDYTGVHAIRASDGAIVWSLPLPAGADPREVRIGDTAGHLTMAWRDQFTVFG